MARRLSIYRRPLLQKYCRPTLTILCTALVVVYVLRWSHANSRRQHDIEHRLPNSTTKRDVSTIHTRSEQQKVALQLDDFPHSNFGVFLLVNLATQQPNAGSEPLRNCSQVSQFLIITHSDHGLLRCTDPKSNTVWGRVSVCIYIYTKSPLRLLY